MQQEHRFVIKGKPLALSIVLPCYNEEQNVERVIAEAVTAGRAVAQVFEVIVVNDGSRDRTGELAQQIASCNPQVRVMNLKTNQGYGGALAAGLKAASFEWVFFTDGDGQFDIMQLAGVLPLLNDCDAVAGYRLNRQDNWRRRLSGWMWTSLVNLVFGMRFRDVDCAFKIFPRSFLQSIEMRSTGALISAELLAKATRARLRIRETGVTHRPRTAGISTGGNPRVIARAFRELIALRKQIRSGR